jgi:hypothetical protein
VYSDASGNVTGTSLSVTGSVTGTAFAATGLTAMRLVYADANKKLTSDSVVTDGSGGLTGIASLVSTGPVTATAAHMGRLLIQLKMEVVTGG